MTTYNKSFNLLYDVGASESFACGDAKNHTFFIEVSDVDTSVDYNFQITLDNENWVDLESSDVQKTADGNFIYTYSDYYCMAVRANLKAQVGGTKATITVGTVVFTAKGYSPEFENYSIETTVGVDAGSEVASISGTEITIQGNAASTIEQIQTAIAANAEVAALITADSLTTFAADTAADLAGSDSVSLNVIYKGGD